MVFRRTCGSYSQLLDCLRTDGFVPLHYSLVWVISRVVKPTPFVLRFFPALCGTLMVPAIYFFARQLLDRRTSLLAAVITACSAFMLYYSRDAKMYMDAWLLLTLSTASLLWWFRAGGVTPWLCWVAAGCAACGLHMSAAVPLAVSPLLLLTQRRLRWQQSLLWIGGIVVILSGPIGYYEKFNTWVQRSDEDWDRSGLQWIPAYNYGRSGPQLVRYLGSTLLTGWEWPKDLDVPNIPADRVNWPRRGFESLIGILILGCLPWPLAWRRSVPGDSFEPPWRIAFWLSLWIVIPTYGFYCHSVTDFATPVDWWHWLPLAASRMQQRALLILIGLLLTGTAAAVFQFPMIRPAVWRGAKLLTVIAAVIALCWLVAMVSTSMAKSAEAAGKPWESLWVPRYLGFIWPMLTVAVAAVLMRLPTRPVRWTAIGFLLGLNLAMGCYRIIGQTEPPVDRMAADWFAAESPANHTLIWTHMPRGGEAPGTANLYSEPAEYYLELLENKPTDPVQFRVNFIKRLQQSAWMWRMPWDNPVPDAVTRIVFWSQYDSSDDSSEPFDPPAGWKLQSDDWYQARDCWIGQNLARYRRSVFVKTAG